MELYFFLNSLPKPLRRYQQCFGTSSWMKIHHLTSNLDLRDLNYVPDNYSMLLVLSISCTHTHTHSETSATFTCTHIYSQTELIMIGDSEFNVYMKVAVLSRHGYHPHRVHIVCPLSLQTVCHWGSPELCAA